MPGGKRSSCSSTGRPLTSIASLLSDPVSTVGGGAAAAVATITSTAVSNGPSFFEDWALVASRLRSLAATARGEDLASTPVPPSPPPRQLTHSPSISALPRAWSALIRSGLEVVAFASIVWDAPSANAARALEETLADEVGPALAVALRRVRSQGRALAHERAQEHGRAQALQKLQTRFLQRISHGARPIHVALYPMPMPHAKPASAFSDAR